MASAGSVLLAAVAVADAVTEGWGDGAVTDADAEGDGALLTAAGAVGGGAEVGAGADCGELQATSTAMRVAASWGALRVSITWVTRLM